MHSFTVQFIRETLTYWVSAANLKRTASASWSGAATTQLRFLVRRYEFAALQGDARATLRGGKNVAALIGGAGLFIKYFLEMRYRPFAALL